LRHTAEQKGVFFLNTVYIHKLQFLTYFCRKSNAAHANLYHILPIKHMLINYQ